MALTAEQRAVRLTGLGGSDAAAALGISPWRTPYELWHEKTTGQERPDDEETEAMEWGSLLEEPVARKFQRVTGLAVQPILETMRAPGHPWMLANIDRAIIPANDAPVVWDAQAGRLSTDAILEVKTSGFFKADEWGDEGSDEIPDHYLAQVGHYLFVTGARVCHVAALFQGQRFRRYRVERDPELIEMIVEGERDFWRRVQDKDPPPLVTMDDLKLRFPRSGEDLVEAPAEIVEALRQLHAERALAEASKTRIEGLELQIKSFIGANAGLTVRGTIAATWKRARDGNKLDAERLLQEQPETFARYLKPAPGSRRFLLKEIAL